jgi:hypothetical protein
MLCAATLCRRLSNPTRAYNNNNTLLRQCSTYQQPNGKGGNGAVSPSPCLLPTISYIVCHGQRHRYMSTTSAALSSSASQSKGEGSRVRIGVGVDGIKRAKLTPPIVRHDKLEANDMYVNHTIPYHTIPYRVVHIQPYG